MSTYQQQLEAKEQELAELKAMQKEEQDKSLISKLNHEIRELKRTIAKERATEELSKRTILDVELHIEYDNLREAIDKTINAIIEELVRVFLKKKESQWQTAIELAVRQINMLRNKQVQIAIARESWDILNNQYGFVFSRMLDRILEDYEEDKKWEAIRESQQQPVQQAQRQPRKLTQSEFMQQAWSLARKLAGGKKGSKKFLSQAMKSLSAAHPNSK